MTGRRTKWKRLPKRLRLAPHDIDPVYKGHPLWERYRIMRQRAHREGIHVCKRWLAFPEFVYDVGWDVLMPDTELSRLDHSPEVGYHSANVRLECHAANQTRYNYSEPEALEPAWCGCCKQNKKYWHESIHAKMLGKEEEHG